MALTAMLGGLGLVAGCSSAGDGTSAPNTAGSATVVPGAVPKLGQGSAGGISITATSIVRTGTKLAITAQIHSDETNADALTAVGSNVGPTLTLTTPVQIPAGGTVSLGGASEIVVDQDGRLSPGGTVALSFQFNAAGAIEVFSSFRDAS
ncbi:MAG TPA: hypothetical protein VHX15_06495 [Frankiaceae bacterium]|jgi:hypothetical protein|nr:hypothetical protein [Frankiaceae bacterium]